MIPAYNCDEYLEQTIRSVVSQLGDGAQIEVVDDRSTVGAPEALVARAGAGRVTFFGQPANVGHTRNFNTCLSRARGELVHLLHGDDFVHAGFYERVGAIFDEAPDAGAVICRHTIVDETGVEYGLGPLLRETPGLLDDWLPRIAAGQLLKPPAVVVRRDVYERIGGYDERIAGYGEDWEMWVRVAAATGVWFEPTALAAYRTRPDSLSAPERLAANMRDMRCVLASNRRSMAAVLPMDEVRRVDHAARKALGEALVRRARRALNGGSRRAPARSAIEAIRCSRDAGVAASSAALMLRWAAAAVRR